MQVGSIGRRRIRRTLLSVLALLAAVFTIAAPSAQATAAVTITTADDGGVVVHVVTASDVLWVQATVRASTADDAAVVYQSDDLAMDGAGGWHSNPVQLPAEYEHGTYPVDVEYRLRQDASVTHQAGVGNLSYFPHLSVTSVATDRKSTDYDDQDVTVTGAVSTFDPKTGVTGSADAGVKVELAWYAYTGFSNRFFFVDATTGADGTFSQVITPHGATSGGTARVLPADAAQLASLSVAIPDVTAEPTTVRMTASPTSIRMHKGKTFTVHGTVQRLTKDGWASLANASVVTSSSDPWSTMGLPTGVIGSGTTGSAGTYSYAALATRSATVFTYVRPSPYVQVSGSSHTTQLWVPVAGSFGSLHMTIDAFRKVTAKGRLHGPCDNQTVALQYSRNGRTGWVTLARTSQLAYITSTTCGVTITHGGYADGHYRFAHPESDTLLATNSTSVRLHRILTKTTFSISPKTASHNATLHATGAVTQLVAGHWKRYAHARVVLVYRPKGDSTWYWVVKGWTTSSGHYALKGKAYGDGSWGVYYAPDGAHYYSQGKTQYVNVT